MGSMAANASPRSPRTQFSAIFADFPSIWVHFPSNLVHLPSNLVHICQFWAKIGSNGDHLNRFRPGFRISRHQMGRVAVNSGHGAPRTQFQSFWSIFPQFWSIFRRIWSIFGHFGPILAKIGSIFGLRDASHGSRRALGRASSEETGCRQWLQRAVKHLIITF